MMQAVENITIKQANVNDVELLHELSIVTFADTFSEYNTPEDMKMYIEKYFSHENLCDELDSKENFFFVAFCNGESAGYFKLRIPQEHLHALENNNSIELERIYVLKKLQGTGLGYKLMQYALEYSKQNDFDTLWLGVWEKNEKAINFYKKCGFEIFDEHEFMLGNDKQNDFLMKKSLINQVLYSQ